MPVVSAGRPRRREIQGDPVAGRAAARCNAPMRVTVLGSGTAVPSFERFPAGHLVQAEGLHMAVDLGPGVLRRLAQAGVDPAQLDAVYLTHYHTDHCADLAALLFALRSPRYAGRKRLRVAGGPGLRAFLHGLAAVWPWAVAKGYELEVLETGPGRADLGALRIEGFAVQHTDASLAWRVTAADGATVTFSGDADLGKDLLAAARGAALFVCDAAFPDSLRQEGHLTPGLAGRLAAEARVGTLCLTHFYPECDGHDLAAQARAHFAGPLVLARDLDAFEVRPGTARLVAR